MTQNKTYKSGFSLIELSIVLTIISIVAYGTISAGMIQMEAASVRQSSHKLDRIETAMTLFFKTYGYLPCPADPALAPTNTNFGRDTITHTGTNSTGATATNCSTGSVLTDNATANSVKVYIGTVPVKTLGLPDQYAFDGWNNRITYIVSRHCVAPNNWQDNSGTYTFTYKCNEGGGTSNDTTTSGGKIDIGYSGSNWTPTLGKPVYMTISHGKNGYGAYSNIGTKRTAPTATSAGDEEEINGNLSTTGAAVAATTGYSAYRDRLPSNVAGATYYDDLVRFRTATQIYFDASR